VSGFWHGANWTFVVWGAINAVYFIPLLLANKNRTHLDIVAADRKVPTVREFFQISLTFFITCLAWVFFRSANITESFGYLKRGFTNLSFNIEYLNIERYSVEMGLLLLFFIGVEWLHRHWEHPFQGRFSFVKTIGIIGMILLFGVFSNHQSFIYFQF